MLLLLLLQDYQSGMSVLHTFYADQLLKLCRANGGELILDGILGIVFSSSSRKHNRLLSQGRAI